MVTRDPNNELASPERLAKNLSRIAFPFLIGVKIVKADYLGVDMFLIRACASGETFAAIIFEHFMDRVGQQLGAGGSAAATEQVERKKNSASFHFTGILRPIRLLLSAKAQANHRGLPHNSTGCRARTKNNESWVWN